MKQLLDDLVKVMTLERLELNLFRGESRDIGSPQVFGGQVLGQALVAASATVENRMVHSLHAYFLRRGDFNSPIVYEVDRARDGNHVSTRRIVAIQHGAQIFNMSASFQTEETGLDHQIADARCAAARQSAGTRGALPRHSGRFTDAHAAHAGVRSDPSNSAPRSRRVIRSAIRSVRRASTVVSGGRARFRTTKPCIAACWPTYRISACSTPR